MHQRLAKRGFNVAQKVLHLRYEGPPPPIPEVDTPFSIRLANGDVDMTTITGLHNEANLRSFGFVPMSSGDAHPVICV